VVNVIKEKTGSDVMQMRRFCLKLCHDHFLPLTAWGRAVLEKLMVPQLVKEVTAF
jgi:hypothetical protein